MRTAITVVMLGLFAGLGSAHAQEYPSRPIRLIVGYAQGGGNDVIARMTAARLQESFGQPVIVENKPGADTIIATDFVAKAPADGYTVLVNAMGGFTITPALHPKLPYDPAKDFVAVGTLASFPHVLSVHSSVPATSVRELVQYAKANPGRLNYGGASPIIHLATELFSRRTGIQLTHIPYKGSSPAVQALLANEIQVLISDATPLVAQVSSGRIRLLAVTSKDKLELLPRLPALAESAELADFDLAPWIGLFVRTGTPQPIVQALNRQIAGLADRADVRERLKALGAEPVGDSLEAAASRVREDTRRFAEAVRLLGLGGASRAAK